MLGYPIGGDSLAVSAGVVSRVQMTHCEEGMQGGGDGGEGRDGRGGREGTGGRGGEGGEGGALGEDCGVGAQASAARRCRLPTATKASQSLGSTAVRAHPFYSHLALPASLRLARLHEPACRADRRRHQQRQLWGAGHEPGGEQHL